MEGRRLILKKVVEVLKSGGVIMHPTETCYGLAADIFNLQAIKKVYAIKKMKADKPVSIMVRNLYEAKKYARFNKMALKLAEKYWPGPLTIIVPRKKALPAYLNRGYDTVGIRCPDSKTSMELILANGGPLTTTSANITGQPEVYKVKDFLQQVSAGVAAPDYIMDEGKIAKNKPSTIVEVSPEGVRIIRKGDLVLE